LGVLPNEHLTVRYTSGYETFVHVDELADWGAMAGEERVVLLMGDHMI
jgi:hypothetical protein